MLDRKEHCISVVVASAKPECAAFKLHTERDMHASNFDITFTLLHCVVTSLTCSSASKGRRLRMTIRARGSCSRKYTGRRHHCRGRSTQRSTPSILSPNVSFIAFERNSRPSCDNVSVLRHLPAAAAERNDTVMDVPSMFENASADNNTK